MSGRVGRTHLRIAGVLAIAMVGITACTPEALANDPDGQNACKLLSKARTATDSKSQLRALRDANNAAAKSTTSAIRAAFDAFGKSHPKLGDVKMAEVGALEAACEANGYIIPDLVPAT